MAAGELEGLRILVVENDPLNAELLRLQFDSIGMRIEGPLATWSGAVAHIGRRTPDVALLDFRLADGTAEPVADALDALGIPYVFVSGQMPEQFPARFTSRPRLLKPYRFENLIAALEAVLVPHPHLPGNDTH